MKKEINENKGLIKSWILKLKRRRYLSGSHPAVDKVRNLVKLAKGGTLSRVVAVAGIIVLALVAFSFYKPARTLADSAYTWVQNSWTGGADTVNFPSHPGNKTGWTKYFSKDTTISDALGISLSSSSSAIPDNTTAAFSAGAQSNTSAPLGQNKEILLKPDGATAANGWECAIGTLDGAVCGVPTVTIGSQVWMKYNLNAGTRINGSSNAANNGTVEKYCYGDNEANCTTYGGLYQWNEAMGYTTTQGVQGICPSGFHIPTDAELTTLTNNQSNLYSGSFQAKLAGYRNTYGSFYDLGSYGYLWSSTQGNSSNAWYRFVNSSSVYRTSKNKDYGLSVRCLKN